MSEQDKPAIVVSKVEIPDHVAKAIARNLAAGAAARRAADERADSIFSRWRGLFARLAKS